LDRTSYAGRQRVDVHLQPHLQRQCRADGAPDHLVQLRRLRPVRLVPERVEAEDLPALGDQHRIQLLIVGTRVGGAVTAGEGCGHQHNHSPWNESHPTTPEGLPPADRGLTSARVHGSPPVRDSSPERMMRANGYYVKYYMCK